MYILVSCFGLKFLELGIGTITVNVKASRQYILKVENGSHEFSF